jgi:uncharacterized DUF497 family protein
VRFEWHRAKAEENVRQHGVSFDEAVTVFYEPLSATFNDEEHSADEARLITVGYSARRRLLVVAHTEHGASVRIVSARRATARERKRHET